MEHSHTSRLNSTYTTQGMVCIENDQNRQAITICITYTNRIHYFQSLSLCLLLSLLIAPSSPGASFVVWTALMLSILLNLLEAAVLMFELEDVVFPLCRSISLAMAVIFLITITTWQNIPMHCRSRWGRY